MKDGFSHIDTWVFDLDNTLYDAEQYVFPEMGRRMTGFVAELLDLTEDVADKVRKDYFHKYGTTLRGLMTEHGVAPDIFLQDVHDFDIAGIMPCAVTREGLSRLQGRKFIFTNAPRHFAMRMLAHLNIADLFDDVFAVEDADYWPKPHLDTYHAFIRKHRIQAARSCMFEDMAVNLKPAHDLGMTTVWVHASSKLEKHDHIHHSHENLRQWIAHAFE